MREETTVIPFLGEESKTATCSRTKSWYMFEPEPALAPDSVQLGTENSLLRNYWLLTSPG